MSWLQNRSKLNIRIAGGAQLVGDARLDMYRLLKFGHRLKTDFNPYTRQGRAAGLSSAGHESILTTTGDEPVASYCYLCTTMEYPEGVAWVIFNLREDVTFSDGTPMTA